MDYSSRFSLSPDLSPISLHISPVYAASHSLCTRVSPPISPGRVATVHMGGNPSCRPPSLVCAFLPWWATQGVPRASLCLTSLFRLPPPLPSSTCEIRSLSAPGLSRTGLPYYIFLPPPSALPIPPPASLDRRPSPLSVPGGGVVFLILPSPVHPPHPPRVPHRLLVSSEL